MTLSSCSTTLHHPRGGGWQSSSSSSWVCFGPCSSGEGRLSGEAPHWAPCIAAGHGKTDCECEAWLSTSAPETVPSGRGARGRARERGGEAPLSSQTSCRAPERAPPPPEPSCRGGERGRPGLERLSPALSCVSSVGCNVAIYSKGI